MTRVLIVDDHEVVRRGLRHILCDGLAAAEVDEVGTVAEARRALEAGAPDLLLLDINLPGETGLDLLPELRQRWPGLPVLMLSAYPEAEFGLRCLRLGAAGYLTKESAADELVTAARKALAGGKYVTASLAERLAGALGGQPQAGHEALSGRELEVVRLVARGRSQKEVAALLGLSEKTVATYRARIAEKLGVSTNVELTRYAFHHKLVD